MGQGWDIHMAPRANWKGHLKLSLVSCAVAMFRATTTSERISFNIINRDTGNRVRYQVVDAETGDPVADEDRVKGYKTDGDNYILLEDEDFERVALESSHTLDIDTFVPEEEIDRLYLDESYYIVPDDKVGQEAFAVIREAMTKQGVVGLARAVLYRRERVLMLQPRGKGLLATALRYYNEVRKEDPYFDEIPDIKIPGDMVELATHILESKAGHFEPERFEDRYEEALAEMIRAKQAGKAPPKAAQGRPTNVVNLMDALKRSVKAEHSAASEPARRRASRGTTAKKRSSARGSKVKRAS